MTSAKLGGEQGEVAQGELLYKLLHAAFHVADDCEENAQTGEVTYLGGAKETNDLGDLGAAFYDLGLETHEHIRDFCNSFASLSAQNEKLVEALKRILNLLKDVTDEPNDMGAAIDDVLELCNALLSPSRGDV